MFFPSPDLEQMCSLVFRGAAFLQSYVGVREVSVVAEIDELGLMCGAVRPVRREDCDHGIGTDAVEGFGVAGDDAFQRVVFEDAGLVVFFVLGFAGHGGLRDDDGDSGVLGHGIQQSFHE